MLKLLSEITPESGKLVRWATGKRGGTVVRLMAAAQVYEGNSKYKTIGWFVCPVTASGDYDDSKIGTIHLDDLVEEI